MSTRHVLYRGYCIIPGPAGCALYTPARLPGIRDGRGVHPTMRLAKIAADRDIRSAAIAGAIDLARSGS